MISIHLRRKFIDLISKNSYVFCKSHITLSTSTNKQPLESPTAFELLLQKHNLSPKTVSHCLASLTSLKAPEKTESILSFLEENGFSESHLEKLVKHRPRFLTSSLEKNIMPKFKILFGLGCSKNEVADLISNNPWILRRSLKSINCSLSILKGLVGSDAEVVNLLKIYGWYLTNDLEKTLVPNIEFLRSCGIPLDQIIKFVYHFPRFVTMDHQGMRTSVCKADEMGIKRSSKMFIHAVRGVSSMSAETWKTKLQAFRDIGFSEEDILRVFRQAPPVFSVSAEKMIKVKEVVLASGKYDISCIAKSPTSLCRSIEKWYKPKMQVLGILEAKNLISKWPNFTTLCRMTEKSFYTKFVAPYLDEVGDVYSAMTVVSGERESKHAP